MIDPINLHLTLELPFKGERNYLHSTDLVPAIASVARAAIGNTYTYVEQMNFRQRIETSPQVYLLESHEDVTAPVSFKLADAATMAGALWGHLRPTVTPVMTRVPFPEERLSLAIVRTDDSLSMTRVAGFAPLECAVALGKSACQDLIGPGRWMVISLYFNQPLGQELDMSRQALDPVYVAQVKAGPGRDRARVTVDIDGAQALSLRFVRDYQ